MHSQTLPRFHIATPTKNMITGIHILGAGIITASAAGFPAELEVRWTILTLAGAVMVSAMAWMLNEQEESKKQVFGRAIGAILVGVIGSRAFWHWSEWARGYMQDPLLMVGAGVAFGYAGYMLARAIVQVTSRRAKSLVEKKFDQWVMPTEEQIDPDDIRFASDGKDKRKKR